MIAAADIERPGIDETQITVMYQRGGVERNAVATLPQAAIAQMRRSSG